MIEPAAGLRAVRWLKAVAVGQGDLTAALGFAEAQREWGFDRDLIVSHLKAAVGGLELGSISGGSHVAHDLLAALRPLTIAGRMPNLRRTPPRVPLLTQVTGSVAGWAGQGQGRRLSAGTYTRETMELLTVAALSVASDELLADGSMAGERELLRDLLAACVEALDRAFIDPNNTGSPGVTPASVTASGATIPSGGTTIAALDADLALAVQQLADASSNLSTAVWVMSPVMGAGLSLARGSSGAPAYPLVHALGGSLLGLPVLTSAAARDAEAATSDAIENIALIDCSQITYCEAAPTLSVSRNASVEMSDAPAQDATTPTAASTLVSMFQAGAAALLASLAVNWRLRHDGCVQVITGVPVTPDAA